MRSARGFLFLLKLYICTINVNLKLNNLNFYNMNKKILNIDGYHIHKIEGDWYVEESLFNPEDYPSDARCIDLGGPGYGIHLETYLSERHIQNEETYKKLKNLLHKN